LPSILIKITDKQKKQLKQIALKNNDKKMFVQNQEMVVDFIERNLNKENSSLKTRQK
jgi:hypothetical protein